MKEKPFISIVVYLYNRQKEISGFLKSMDKLFSKNFEGYEFVLVNDCSTDKTLKIAKETIKDIKCSVSIINLTRKYNDEIAMLAGADKSIGDYIFEMDSPIIDYPTKLILKTYKKAIKGYDIVAAVPNAPIKLSQRLFYNLIIKFSHLDIGLTLESFRIVSRRAVNSILNITEKTRYRKGLHSYIGFSKTKIHYNKINNKSTIIDRSLSEKISLGLDIIVSFTKLGLIISLFLSIILFLFSLGMGIYALYDYFFGEDIAGTGWASVIAFLSIGFSGIFLILGMLVNYASKILIEAQNRPLYNVKSIETFHYQR